jgi:hypothetical protein
VILYALCPACSTRREVSPDGRMAAHRSDVRDGLAAPCAAATLPPAAMRAAVADAIVVTRSLAADVAKLAASAPTWGVVGARYAADLAALERLSARAVRA